MNCLCVEAGNSNVDINHILTDLQDDPGYSDLLDIKPVDRRAQGPGWVSLASTETQVRKTISLTSLTLEVFEYFLLKSLILYVFVIFDE